MPKVKKGTASHVPSEKEKENLNGYKFNEIPHETLQEYGRKGAKAAAEKKKYNQSFRQAVQWAMELPAMRGNPTVDKLRKEFPLLNNRDAMAISMTAEAIKRGNVKAFEALRDTAGESPKQSVSLDDGSITINIKTVE